MSFLPKDIFQKLYKEIPNHIESDTEVAFYFLSYLLNKYNDPDVALKTFKKTIKVDSDKSMSIRSFLIGSISQSISTASNVLESEDVLSAISCLKKLGVKIVKTKPQSYKIYGKGLGSLFAKKNLTLNFGNSGTLARLLLGILSTTTNIEIKVQGDHSLNKRSMEKLIKLMSEFGAEFLPKNKFNFPLKIISTEMPIGINYKSGVSAQLKSAAILAGLNAFGNTEIIETEKSRDHTENMLLQNSSSIKVIKGKIPSSETCPDIFAIFTGPLN